MLSTQGGKTSLRNTIVSLFGARVEKEQMLEIKESLPDKEVLDLYGLPAINSDDELYSSIKIRGFVSSCVSGCGHSLNDRQFVFINGRPVDYTRMCKVANEVYHTFNRKQQCTLVLFIDLDPSRPLALTIINLSSVSGHIDVNLMPDKRSVFLCIEKEVFAKLRASLSCTFQSVVGDCSSRALQATQSQIGLHDSNSRSPTVLRLILSLDENKIDGDADFNSQSKPTRKSGSSMASLNRLTSPLTQKQSTSWKGGNMDFAPIKIVSPTPVDKVLKTAGYPTPDKPRNPAVKCEREHSTLLQRDSVTPTTPSRSENPLMNNVLDGAGALNPEEMDVDIQDLSDLQDDQGLSMILK